MSAVRDAMASVTDAFLGERTAPRLRDQRALLLVGHLPVMGGLWLTQFADRDARTSGTTALVRVLHGEVELEVLRAGGRKIDVDAKDGFEQALTKVASTVGRWIFCVFGDAEAQIPAALDGIDRVILLTGADDAATVGAYKLLKGFVEHAERAGRAVPPIELCIVGATETEAREMAEKLDRTTRAFLRANLVVGAAIQRMDAVESSFRESYELPSASLDAACAAVTRAVSARASRFDAAQVSATKATTRTPPRATTSVEVDRVDIPPVVPEQFSAVLPFRIGPVNAAPSRVAPVVEYAAVAEATPAPVPVLADVAPTVVVAPKLTIANVVEIAAQTRPSSYAALIRGLSPLAIRPPRWKDIELALDAQGTLHVVAPVSSIEHTMHARQWATEHAELLALAYPSMQRGNAVATDIILERNERGALIVPTTLEAMAYHQITAINLDGRAAWFCQCVESA